MAGLSSPKDDTSSVASDVSIYSGSNHPGVQLLRDKRRSCNSFKRQYIATALELVETTDDGDFEDILPELDAHRSCLHKKVHEYVATAKTVAAIPELADLPILKRTNSALASIRKLWRLSRYHQPHEYRRNSHLPTRDDVYTDSVLPSMLCHVSEPAQFDPEMAETEVDFEEVRRHLNELLVAMQRSGKIAEKRLSNADISSLDTTDLQGSVVNAETETRTTPQFVVPSDETEMCLPWQIQDSQRQDIAASAVGRQEKGFVGEDEFNNHGNDNDSVAVSSPNVSDPRRSCHFKKRSSRNAEGGLQQRLKDSQRHVLPINDTVETCPKDEQECQQRCPTSDTTVLTRRSVPADHGNKAGVHFQRQTGPPDNPGGAFIGTNQSNRSSVPLTQRRQRGSAGSRLGLAHSTLSQAANGPGISDNVLEYDAMVRARELGMKEMEASRPETPVGIMDSADYIILRHKFLEATSNRCLSAQDKLRELQRWFAKPASDLVDAAIIGITAANAQQQLDECLENLDKMFNTRSDTLSTTLNAITNKGTLKHDDYVGHKALCCSLIRAKAVARVCDMVDECDNLVIIRSIINARVPHLADDFWNRGTRINSSFTFDNLIEEIDFWATWNTMKGPGAADSISFEEICHTPPSGRQINCYICEGSHQSHNCHILEAMHDVDQRVKRLMEKSLCFHCFKPGHSARLCTEKPTCAKPRCGRRHATLLHDRSVY